MKKIAIIGGGASGCFCAINIMEMNPKAEVTVFESGLKPLQKLAITGAGRCNITNNFEAVSNLQLIYPRGYNLLKKLFHEFGPQDAIAWFEERGIELFTQDDNRLFPKSNSAADVCDRLLSMMNRHGVWLFTGRKVTGIELSGDKKFLLKFSDKNMESDEYDAVVVSAGGSINTPLSDSIRALGVEIEKGVPSLFNMKVKSNPLTELMGAAVRNTSAMIPGTKFRAEGPTQITHFGFSGPAILKLSSYASRYLAENNYKCDIIINWLNLNEEETRKIVEALVSENLKKNTASAHPKDFTQRLWEFLLMRAEIDPTRKYCELGKKNITKLVITLCADLYHVSGRGQMGEEFVTCGGASLNAVSSKTLEAKAVPGLYFTGEYLDVDAVTGGFNLQNCWTTGYVVAKSVSINN